MGLSQALSTAASGLRTTHAGLSLVASNVANVDTPGYVRKTLSQEATATSESVSVRAATVNRELDRYVQRQLRTEMSGGAYADLKAQFYQRLQSVYGDPSSSSSLETLFANFTGALQSLSANPADYSARASAVGSAQALAQQLNGLTSSIQGLRTDAENGIADAVRSANDALNRLGQINQQLDASSAADAARASLLDQRDHYLEQLSQLMDIRVTEGANGKVDVFTTSGQQLVGAKASQLSFNPQGTVSAQTQWNADPLKSRLGSIMLVSPSGAKIDLGQDRAIRSGQLAAYLEMRDTNLVQAQRQLDEFAAAMSRALSDQTTAGTAVAPGAQSGFDIDIGGLQAGNTIQVTYRDSATATARTVTLVRVSDPGALPLPNSTTANPNDKVVGIDWSGGMISVLAQLNAAFGGKVQFSNPAGTTLRALNDGAASASVVDSVSATTTVTTLSGGTSQLPLFVDGQFLFTGAITGGGSQTTGLAGRIAVNAGLIVDPSKLIAYSATTPAGDSARPSFIYDQITSAKLTFSPQSGIGTLDAPFSGSLDSFMRQAMSQQGEAASAAQNLSDGQGLVVNALQQRFNDGAAVNVDEEMAKLLTLQTAYGANARVMSTIKEMMQMLIGI